MKLSEMRKLELLNKLVKCLTVPAVIIVLLFSFDILKFNGIGMVILFCVCFITLFIVLVMIANILHKNFKIKKASNLIECNKFASFFAITTDGVNYELNQKIKKKDRKKRVNTIYRLRCFFKKYDKKVNLSSEEKKLILKDLLVISKWLKQNNNIDLITFTHGDMLEILSRNFILEPISSVKKISCSRWCSITLESRGLLLEKPNDYRYYKLTVKNKKLTD